VGRKLVAHARVVPRRVRPHINIIESHNSIKTILYRLDYIEKLRYEENIQDGQGLFILDRTALM